MFSGVDLPAVPVSCFLPVVHPLPARTRIIQALFAASNSSDTRLMENGMGPVGDTRVSDDKGEVEGWTEAMTVTAWRIGLKERVKRGSSRLQTKGKETRYF